MADVTSELTELGGRAKSGVDLTESLLGVAVARLRLAEERERMSRSPIWLLDRLAAIEELRALSHSSAPDPRARELFDTMREFSDYASAEGGRALFDALAPHIDRLSELANVDDQPVIDRLRHLQTSSKEFEVFRRERVAPMVTERLASERVFIGPDVRASGLLPDERRVEDERRSNSRTIRVLLDSHVSEHLMGLRRCWPEPEVDPSSTAWPALWGHLTGLVAACAADRLGLGGEDRVARLRSLVGAGLSGRPVNLPPRPPSAPTLYASYVEDRRGDGVVKLEPETKDGRLHLSARLPMRTGPIVVTLLEDRTCGAGSINSALTFAYWSPHEAGELLAEVGVPSSSNTPDMSQILADPAHEAETPYSTSARVVTLLRSARERLSDEVLRQLERSTTSRLVESRTDRSRIEDVLDQLDDLDRLIPL